jgi:GNAT superfamily N-acetyltransferase
MSRNLIEQGLTWSWTPARVQHFISGPDSTVVVARRERQIAAFAIMHFGDEVAHLNLLAVAPEHRRQGLGRQLMSWLTETAMTAGVFRINLELRTHNEPASCRATTKAGKRHCVCRAASASTRFNDGVRDAGSPTQRDIRQHSTASAGDRPGILENRTSRAGFRDRGSAPRS